MFGLILVDYPFLVNINHIWYLNLSVFEANANSNSASYTDNEINGKQDEKGDE